ncbi:MAG: hypothetical protein ACE147_09890 [Candidatus Methylomirabilales bacterium]
MVGRTTARNDPKRHGAFAIKEGKALRVLDLAMRLGKQVSATHRGRLLAVSPHVIGRKGRDLYVLAFGVATGPEGVAPLRWQWLPVMELHDLTVREGFWLTGPGERPSAEFLDTVIAEATLVGGPESEEDVPAMRPSLPEEELPTL